MRFSLVSIVLCGVAAIAQGQPTVLPAGTTPTSQVVAALRVSCDRASGLADEELLARLVTSQEVYREAIGNVSKEAAELPPAEVALVSAQSWDKAYGASRGPMSGEGSNQRTQLRLDRSSAVGLVSVAVMSLDERVDAKKLLAAIGTALEHRLQALDTDHTLEEYRLRLEKQRVEMLTVQVEKQHQALATLAAIHKVDVDATIGAQKRLHLETELQSLDAQLEGLKARRQVIEHQIAQLAENVSKAVGSAEIVKALEARIDTQRAIFQRIQDANQKVEGTFTRPDMDVARAKMLEAEAELAKFRAEAARDAGGGRVAQLKQRLDDTAIEIAELEAKRKALQEQLQAASGSSGQVERKRIELELLERQYRRAAEELSELQSAHMKYFPPQVTVIPL